MHQHEDLVGVESKRGKGVRVHYLISLLELRKMVPSTNGSKNIQVLLVEQLNIKWLNHLASPLESHFEEGLKGLKLLGPGAIDALQGLAELLKLLLGHLVCLYPSSEEAHPASDVVVNELRVNEPLSNNRSTDWNALTRVQVGHPEGMSAALKTRSSQ